MPFMFHPITGIVFKIPVRASWIVLLYSSWILGTAPGSESHVPGAAAGNTLYLEAILSTSTIKVWLNRIMHEFGHLTPNMHETHETVASKTKIWLLINIILE